MCLLIGGLDVSLGNADLEKYVPFTYAWMATTVIIGAIFVVQTARERKQLGSEGAKLFQIPPHEEIQNVESKEIMNTSGGISYMS